MALAKRAGGRPTTTHEAGHARKDGFPPDGGNPRSPPYAAAATRGMSHTTVGAAIIIATMMTLLEFQELAELYLLLVGWFSALTLAVERVLEAQPVALVLLAVRRLRGARRPLAVGGVGGAST